MNKPLALLSIIAVSLPLVGCLDEPARHNNIFHNTEESPRTGATQRPNRWGYKPAATNTPSEQGTNRNTGQNDPNPDPNGIVKPRDLDPTAPDGSVTTPGTPNVAVDPGAKKEPVTPVSPTSGEPPYAEAVPGKYGLVYSPFVADKKNALVNVTDENNVAYPPGTEVTDPHTGKIFRVP